MWLIAAVFAAFGSIGLAQEKPADTSSGQQYKLRVLLRCGAHNWLSDQFRADLCANLASTLQAALGGMADVEVLDLKKTPDSSWEKWWRDVDTRGLTVLDSVAAPTGDKTHFLRVDFRNGRYEIQARQIDASTGLISPLRQEVTDDRAFVGRLAGQMLAQDFGIVGMVEGSGDNVNVSFKGGNASAVLPRWIQKGDILALVYMSAPRPPDNMSRGAIEPDSFVQVLQNPAGGKAPCRVVYRGRFNPLTQRGSVSFRCVKLPTVVGPLRLQILDDKGQPHAKALQIRVHSESFQTGESAEEEVLSPDKGMFISSRPYENIAFVRVVTGASQIARMPVAIFADRPTVTMIKIDAAAEELGQLVEARRNLLHQYNEALVVQMARREETSRLASGGKFEDALKYTKVSRSTLEQDMDRLAAQRNSLQKEIGSHPLSLDECAKYDKVFVDHKSTLNLTIFNLTQVVDEMNSPERKQKELELRTMFTQAQLHESNFDIEEAIAAYEAIQKKFGDQPQVTKRLGALKPEWALKSEAQRTARDFVYKEWTKVKTAAEAEAKLPKVRESLQSLKTASDQLSLYKLRNSLPELIKRLSDEIQQVAQSENPDDAAKKAKLQKFGEEFDKFGQEVEAAIGSLTKKE
jgi:hypothetical protein